MILRIAKFEIEIKDKRWNKDSKIILLYKFLYYVKQVEDKMEKKQKKGPKCKNNCKFTCQHGAQ